MFNDFIKSRRHESKLFLLRRTKSLIILRINWTLSPYDPLFRCGKLSQVK